MHSPAVACRPARVNRSWWLWGFPQSHRESRERGPSSHALWLFGSERTALPILGGPSWSQSLRVCPRSRSRWCPPRRHFRQGAYADSGVDWPTWFHPHHRPGYGLPSYRLTVSRWLFQQTGRVITCPQESPYREIIRAPPEGIGALSRATHYSPRSHRSAEWFHLTAWSTERSC